MIGGLNEGYSKELDMRDSLHWYRGRSRNHPLRNILERLSLSAEKYFVEEFQYCHFDLYEVTILVLLSLLFFYKFLCIITMCIGKTMLEQKSETFKWFNCK